MKTTTYSKFKTKSKSLINMVVDEHAPLCITTRLGKDVVVLSKEDYDGIQETLYLLSSPANSMRLQKSIQQYQTGFELSEK
jgi:antitoxin YefM